MFFRFGTAAGGFALHLFGFGGDQLAAEGIPLQQALVPADGIDLGAVEQAAGAFGIGAHEGAVTNLDIEEGLVIAGGG